MDKEISNTIRCGGGSLDGKHTWDIVLIGGEQKNQSVKTDGISTCLCSAMGTGGGCVPMICVSRGRNPENPSDRTAGAPTEQRLEVNQTGCSNTITTVEKDNYILEPQVKQVGNLIQTDSFGGNPERGRVYSDKGISPCLSTMQGGGLEPKITENLRIRKLTPRECWRLMGVKDEQFNKIHDISNSQLYKLAGNSIVVDVLMAIFNNLLLSDEGTTGQLTLF